MITQELDAPDDDCDTWQSQDYQPPAERIPAAAAEVWQLLASGLTPTQIAERLCVTPETVQLLTAEA